MRRQCLLRHHEEAVFTHNYVATQASMVEPCPVRLSPYPAIAFLFIRQTLCPVRLSPGSQLPDC